MRYYIEEDTSTTPPTLVKVPICGSYINYNTAPIGSIQQYSGTSLPPGWLWCNGSAYNRTFYKFLFNVIGTTYGTGDGSTTFNVPSIPDLATGIKYIIKAYSTADAKTLGIDLPDSPTSGGGHWAHAYEEWTSYLNGMTSGSTFVAPATGSLYVHPQSPGSATDTTYRSYIAPVENGAVMPSIIWVSSEQQQNGNVINNVSSGILKKGHTYKVATNNPNGFCFAAMFLEYIEDEADPDPAGDAYSTIETKVGTWIDGKPIYRKVFTGLPVASTWSQHLVDSSNQESLVSYTILGKSGTSPSTHTSPYYNNASDYFQIALVVGANTLQYWGSASQIRLFDLVVEYTKTTD
jgi:hypothetical protein